MILHTELVAAGPNAAKRLYVLHGIFGAGRNWASVARRLARERTDWAVRLIDLRQHGASQGFDPPHTIASAAADIADAARNVGESPTAILGHSFGGKVALKYAREYTGDLQHVWMIDSTPGARPPSGSAWQMLQLVRTAPREYPSRDALITYLASNGIAVPVAQWMATNLEHVGDRFRWRFDLEAIDALLQDFFREDLWSVLEAPPGQLHIHVVKATESSVLDADAVSRVKALEAGGRVHYHEIAGGHWVNAENPGALHDLLQRLLP